MGPQNIDFKNVVICRCLVIDADSKNRYDKKASGQLDGRGSALRRRVEESPHSTEHGTGETPG